MNHTFYHISEIPPTEFKLDTSRSLFVCRNPMEWYPLHLKEHHCYKISIAENIHLLKTHTTADYELIFNVVVTNDVIESLELTAIGEQVMVGYDGVELCEDNSEGELSEILILDPSKYTIYVENVDVPLNKRT